MRSEGGYKGYGGSYSAFGAGELILVKLLAY